MDFTDFKDNPLGLIGKLVLHESGYTYSSSNLHKKICRIESVLAKGFKISCHPDEIFRLDNGLQKGLTDRSSMSIISKCTLLTEEEAKELSLNWKRAKEERELRKRMKEKVESMTYEQLLEMEKL